jgi:hypothetical protein
VSAVKVSVDLSFLIPQSGVETLDRLDVPQFIYFKKIHVVAVV